jgi:hypothetical protein
VPCADDADGDADEAGKENRDAAQIDGEHRVLPLPDHDDEEGEREAEGRQPPAAELQPG